MVHRVFKNFEHSCSYVLSQWPIQSQHFTSGIRFVIQKHREETIEYGSNQRSMLLKYSCHGASIWKCLNKTNKNRYEFNPFSCLLNKTAQKSFLPINFYFSNLSPVFFFFILSNTWLTSSKSSTTRNKYVSSILKYLFEKSFARRQIEIWFKIYTER